MRRKREQSRNRLVVYDVPDFLMARDTAAQRKRKSLDAIEGEGTTTLATRFP
jgi:hypothetical protein